VPRPWAYFDTSVLVKRYVEEEGTGQSRALLGRHHLLSGDPAVKWLPPRRREAGIYRGGLRL
jgi:hypothetical protein